MSAPLAADRPPLGLAPTTPAAPRRVALVRAVAALVWAGLLALAISGADAGDVPAAAAVLLAAYPLIDVVSSLVEAASARAPRVLRINAAISAAAAAGLAVAAFGSTDAGTVLAVFGAWAIVSGAIQLGTALRRRRAAGTREVPMIVSGGVSALAGAMFAAMAGADDATLGRLAGYAAAGAVLFAVWALRARAAQRVS
jgi:uncharacterized membrane protein HdeD (DUF308 family)